MRDCERFLCGGTGFYSVRVSKISHFRFEGFPTIFRRFPEGFPRGTGKGALNRGFRGRLLSDWLSERALIRVPSGLGTCVKWSQDRSFYCCPRDIECDPASGWEPCEEIELFSRRKELEIDNFYGYF